MRNGILRGEASAVSKLTENDVFDIIKQIKCGKYLTDIAQQYSVSISAISDIATHKTWTHLTKEIEFPNISKHKRPLRKSVDIFDKKMNYITTAESIKEAAELTQATNKMISQVCLGQRKSAHGYIFQFHNTSVQNPINNIAFENYGKFGKQVRGYYKNTSNLYGEFISIKKAAESFLNKNIYTTANYITLCCNGYRDDVYGIRWEFVN